MLGNGLLTQEVDRNSVLLREVPPEFIEFIDFSGFTSASFSAEQKLKRDRGSRNLILQKEDSRKRVTSKTSRREYQRLYTDPGSQSNQRSLDTDQQ